MSKLRMIGVMFGALILATMALASPAQATNPDRPSATATAAECGEITLTFNNPTPHLFAFDYQVDDAAASTQIGGEDFYTIVNIDGRDSDAPDTVTVPLTFDNDSGTHTVRYRLQLGAESDWYLDWQTASVESCVSPEPTPTVEPTPTTDPTPEPTTEPTTAPGTGGGDGDDDGALPVTGVSVPAMAGVGALLLAAGGALVLARRRKVNFTA